MYRSHKKMYQIKQKNILLVKNLDSDRKNIRNLLSETKLVVIEINELSEAIALSGDSRFQTLDVVLLDLNCLEGSGEAAVKQLPTVFPDVPIIALVEQQQEQIALDLLKVGWQDYLVKEEIDRRSLIRAIACAIERQRYLQSLPSIPGHALKATESFRKNTEKKESAIDVKPEIVTGFGRWEFDLKTKILTWSGELEDLEQIDSEIKAVPYQDYLPKIHPDDIWVLKRVLKEAISLGKIHGFTQRLLTSEGSLRYLRCQGQAIFNQTGKLVKLSGTAIDITKFQKNYQELVIRDRFWNNFFQEAPSGMSIFDRQWRPIEINSALAQINGGSPEEYLGKTIREIFPTLADKLIAKMQQVVETGQPLLKQEISGNFVKRGKNHQQYWEWSMFPLSNGQGTITAIGCLIHDISDRQRAEQILHQQWLREHLIGAIQERIRQTLNLDEVLNTAVEEVRKFLQTDRVLIYQFTSQQSGVVIAESVAKGWTKTLGQHIERECFWQTYFPMYQQGWVCDQENIHVLTDAESCPVDLFQEFEIQANLVVPIFQENNLWGLLIAHHCQSPRDWESSEIEALRHISLQLGTALKQSALFEQAQTKIQECQQIEIALRESEQQLKLALEGSALGLWDWDLVSGKIYVSSQWKSMLGYAAEDIADRIDSWQPLIHPEDLRAVKHRLKDHLNGDTPAFDAEFRMRTKSGDWKWIGCYGQVSVRDESGNPLRITGTNQDISDRKQAAEAIERERQQLHQIITHAPVAMAILDRELRYLAHSEKWLTSYDLVGKNIIGDLHSEVLPDIPAHWRENYQEALAGKIVSIPEECWERAKGQKIYLRRSIHPWYTPEGQVGGIVIATERIDQLVEAREKALEAVRFKSLFFANMSHEIRTPMNGVLALCELLLQTPLTAEQLDFVTTLKVSGHHLLSIINDLLDFSKLEAAKLRLNLQEFNLNQCIEDVIDLLAPQANAKGLQLAVLIDPNVPRQLIGDDLRLRQILTNLVSNALKFTDNGEVIIYVERNLNARAKAKKHQQNQTNPHDLPLFKGGDRGINLLLDRPEQVSLKFSVKDTGIGISRANQKQLFQVFSQVHKTAQKYGGTGLGLAICKQFVQLMGGQIGVKSKLNQGSTFWFTATFGLVTTRDNIEISPETNTSETLVDLKQARQALAGKKMLVIDQNPTNRTVVRLAAKTWGMTVEETDNPVTALTHLCSVTAQAIPYDVVLLDWDMLKSDREFRAQLLRLQPALKSTQVILMTTISNHKKIKQLSGLTFSDYLVKPIIERRLQGTIMKGLGVNINHQSSLKLMKHQMASDVKILVVDDTPMNQKVIRHQLAMLGYVADFVSNGQEALAQLLEKDYDLVFMDCQMPVLDGYESTKALRKREAENQNDPKKPMKTIVIGLTAYGMNDPNPDGSGLNHREKCLAAGMDDYLSKPVSLEQLGAVIQKWGEPRSQTLAKNDNVLPSVKIANGAIADSLTHLAQLVNLERLANLTRGDRELQAELLNLFVTQAQTNLDDIEKALEIEDFSTVSAKAHQLKGSSANVAVKEMPNLAAELDHCAQQKNSDRARNILGQLQQKNADLQQAMTGIEKSSNLQPEDLLLPLPPLPRGDQGGIQKGGDRGMNLVHDRSTLTESNTSNKIPIDFERLRKLSGGNQAFERKLLQTLVQQIDTYLEQIIAAAAVKNYDEISHKVHQIKGASSNVGILRMPELAREIQNNVTQNNFTAISEQVNQLQQIHQQLKQFIAGFKDNEIAHLPTESKELQA
jgi:PAS domain S-box-containing protein